MEVKRRMTLAATTVVIAFVACAPRVMAASFGQAPTEYQQYCAGCHGKDGGGDGPLGAFLSPRPRDFANCKVMKTITDQTLFNAIKNGGASVGVSPNMPAWGGSFNDPQIHDLVKYVRKFCPQHTASK